MLLLLFVSENATKNILRLYFSGFVVVSVMIWSIYPIILSYFSYWLLQVIANHVALPANLTRTQWARMAKMKCVAFW